MRRLYLLIGLISGCVEPELVRVLDGDGDGVGLLDVPRGSLVDLDRVEGPHARFLVGADFDIVPWLGDPATRDRAARKLERQVRPPRARWSSHDNTAVAQDFDTLALFTAYVHVERTFGLFEDVGLTGPPVDQLDVLYLPELRDGPRVGMSTTDNAYYFLPNDTVLLLPPERLQDLPLAMNPGVIAHELTHRVVHHLLWEGRRLEVLESLGLRLRDDPAVRDPYLLLLSLDEGVADYVGAVSSGEPGFIGLSVESLQEARDLTVLRTYPSEWIGRLPEFEAEQRFNPYMLGSIVASALWATGEAVDHLKVVPAVFEALEAMAPGATRLETRHVEFETGVLRALDGDEEACRAFSLVYWRVWDLFTEVCPCWPCS